MADQPVPNVEPSSGDAAEDPSSGDAATPLPIDIERAAAYAWQRGARETILFQGRAQLITAAGPIDLESGAWLLTRWSGLTLEDTPDGELICILPESV